MRFASTLFASVLAPSCFNSLPSAKGMEHSRGSRNNIFNDERTFWNRLLRNGIEGSMPSPSLRPSKPESPSSDAPVATPIVPPSHSTCDIQVDLSCVLSDDQSTSCDTVQEVSKFECSECAPVALCFVYTALACESDHDWPPGIKECIDELGGPQLITDIIISNGDKVFVDQTITRGDEICVTNGNAVLPAELNVSISAPMGGIEPEVNQISTIDSSCGGEGLTLLQSYGALTLSHFIDCKGDNDCFIPVKFDVSVTNSGSRKLDLENLSLSVNGEPQSIAVGMLNKTLEKDDVFLASTKYTALQCNGSGFEAYASAVAIGFEGKTCQGDASQTYN